MHPSSRDLMAGPGLRRSPASATGARGVIRSQSHISRLTSEESWIEVASQPSSSSLSSVAPEEVVTTGLRVTQSVNPRRRRRLRSTGDGRFSPRATSSAGSSQEEYESESGSDPNMSNSNLEYQARFTEQEADEGSDSANDRSYPSLREIGSDEDTALGVADPSPVFTPQPNAFSHPSPASRPLPASRAATDSTLPSSGSLNHDTPSVPASTPPTSTSSIPSRAHNRRRSHTPYTMLAPSHSVPVDHDAALRASLSTLLSCAAAARGLPKRESSFEGTSTPSARPPVSSQRVEPSSLRLISESTLDGPPGDTANAPTLPQRPPPITRTSSTSSSFHSGQAAKRRAKSPIREKRKKQRHATSQEAVISPTLMTWVIGAGVMVLFSAISFSAGYALGREIGRVEATHLASTGTPYSGEDPGFLGRSVSDIRNRVLRWGNMNGSGIRV